MATAPTPGARRVERVPNRASLEDLLVFFALPPFCWPPEVTGRQRFDLLVRIHNSEVERRNAQADLYNKAVSQ